MVSGYDPGSSLLCVEIDEEPDGFEGNSVFCFVFVFKGKKKTIIAKHNLNKNLLS